MLTDGIRQWARARLIDYNLSSMKKQNWLFTISLYLNGILILALAGGYGYLRFQQEWWESEGSAWAMYAGTLQSAVDHENGRTRYYRMVMTTATRGQTKSKFTGQYKDGVEIWSWSCFSGLGNASCVSTQEFVSAYNRRMEAFVKETTTRPAERKRSARGCGP
jgi:hypothetical protein